ncbi:hypothetical protein CONCODRAFT_34973 [Conidiobolus coronatus NRRL 28638]|uniref:NmrA-like domain-containing protein n=1 Tax=Conidiobolus coronatus (strain ATCC 28846 / CBS 209.66 / NRRL 28638) TaxID=796925 RepID=A0A137PGL1_CONC2|nr:hypothetical protein CONCODRAFT_34973 [Conidiobolus coronatus NRRL 28638]|eukprot:KXN74137.1 hypothetical protein CONCODRAFT_34973 [Conidiobolus coronatus NRRL 28638]
MTKLKPFVFAACEPLGFGIVEDLLTCKKLKDQVECVGSGVLDGSRKNELEKMGAEVVQYKEDDLSSVKDCLKKANCAIVIVHEHKRGFEMAGEMMKETMNAGIKHVKLISLMNADKTPNESHLKKFCSLEEIYEKSKFEGAIIRCGMYTDLLIHSSKSIRDNGELKLNLGEGKVAPIAKCEVSYFVACALVKYHGKADTEKKFVTVCLTGNKLRNGKEIAKRISEAIDNDVEYKEVEKDEMKRILKDQDLSEHHIQCIVDVLEIGKNNHFDKTSDIYKEVTGEEPKGIKHFIDQNGDSFKPKKSQYY